MRGTVTAEGSKGLLPAGGKKSLPFDRLSLRLDLQSARRDLRPTPARRFRRPLDGLAGRGRACP